MEIKVIMLINLVAYSFMVSQSFSYIIALTDVQKNMQPAAYIELRKLLDKNYRAKYSIVIYTSLITGILLTILSSMNLSGILFISSAIALAALIADIILAVKGNVPINKIINTWSVETYPHNWTDYRARWLSIFAKRQIVNIVGFLSLLLGAIFGS
ncbi:MAG: hypothetical protein H7Z13_04465 [Ferruginibacter sp.]|nr:hypothetical protein [Ferruginibacter sp.]